MSESMALEPVVGRGWRRGLGPLVRAEMAGWWRTRQWMVTTAICLVAINVVLLAMILVSGSKSEADLESDRKIARAALEAQVEQGSVAAQRQLEQLDAGPDPDAAPASVMLFCTFAGLFVAIASSISMQGAIIGEKKSGTAEWVLSGPVSRSAFVLAKLAGNVVGFLATAVAIPAAIAYLEMTALEGLQLPLLGFLAGAGVIALHTLFYLTLTLMLGTLFEHWGPIVGIPLALIGVQSFAMNLWPFLSRFLPWGLALPMGGQEAIALSLMHGAAPATLAPVIVTGACAVLFSVVAVLRFRRQEF